VSIFAELLLEKAEFLLRRARMWLKSRRITERLASTHGLRRAFLESDAALYARMCLCALLERELYDSLRERQTEPSITCHVEAACADER
jgi:hypothetical protein